jgi:hypothetical protein
MQRLFTAWSHSRTRLTENGVRRRRQHSQCNASRVSFLPDSIGHCQAVRQDAAWIWLRETEALKISKSWS